MAWWSEQKQAWRADWVETGRSLQKDWHTTKRVFGHVVRLVVYVGLFLLLYVYWPEKNIFDIPFAALTLGDVLRTGFMFAAAFWLASQIFQPDPDANEAWQSLGVLGIVGGVIAYFYFTKH